MPLLMLFFFMGCSHTDQDLFQENPGSFPGKWLLVETSFSAGGELEYQEVKNGGYFYFLTDGTFTSVNLDPCGNGTYELRDNQLTLTYNCQIQEGPNPFTFSIKFQEDYFILAPLTIMCIEGCPSKYKKLQN